MQALLVMVGSVIPQVARHQIKERTGIVVRSLHGVVAIQTAVMIEGYPGSKQQRQRHRNKEHEQCGNRAISRYSNNADNTQQSIGNKITLQARKLLAYFVIVKLYSKAPITVPSFRFQALSSRLWSRKLR